MHRIKAESIDKIEEKTQEIQAKVDAYIAAQQHQLQHGGAGPVADFDIMKIVNEYQGQFEVYADEPEIEEEE